MPTLAGVVAWMTESAVEIVDDFMYEWFRSASFALEWAPPASAHRSTPGATRGVAPSGPVGGGATIVDGTGFYVVNAAEPGPSAANVIAFGHRLRAQPSVAVVTAAWTLLRIRLTLPLREAFTAKITRGLTVDATSPWFARFAQQVCSSAAFAAIGLFAEPIRFAASVYMSSPPSALRGRYSTPWGILWHACDIDAVRWSHSIVYAMIPLRITQDLFEFVALNPFNRWLHVFVGRRLLGWSSASEERYIKLQARQQKSELAVLNRPGRGAKRPAASPMTSLRLVLAKSQLNVLTSALAVWSWQPIPRLLAELTFCFFANVQSRYVGALLSDRPYASPWDAFVAVAAAEGITSLFRGSTRWFLAAAIRAAIDAALSRRNSTEMSSA